MEGKEFSVKITEEGDVLFLYSDRHVMKDIVGKMQLQRASNVVWDMEKQKWTISFNRPGGGHEVWEHEFEWRDDAIQFEIDTLNQLLQEGVAVEELFVEGTSLDD